MSAREFALFCVGLIFGALLERLDRRYMGIGFRALACRAWRWAFTYHLDRALPDIVGAVKCRICGRVDVDLALALLGQDVERWDAHVVAGPWSGRSGR